VVNADIQLSGGNDDGWVAAQMAFRDALAPALPQPTSVAFTTAAQSLTHGVCSNPVTITSQAGATATRTAIGVHLILSGASNLTFYADPACAFPITTADIGAGRDSVTFYFKGASAGSPVLSVASPFSSVNTTQTETVN
jgi:hypothetical protein